MNGKGPIFESLFGEYSLNFDMWSPDYKKDRKVNSRTTSFIFDIFIDFLRDIMLGMQWRRYTHFFLIRSYAGCFLFCQRHFTTNMRKRHSFDTHTSHIYKHISGKQIHAMRFNIFFCRCRHAVGLCICIYVRIDTCVILSCEAPSDIRRDTIKLNRHFKAQYNYITSFFI